MGLCDLVIDMRFCRMEAAVAGTSAATAHDDVTMHACLVQPGSIGVFVDEKDSVTTCRLAPVGDPLVLADFAGDPSKSRFRQLDIFMVESGSPLPARSEAPLGVVPRNALRLAAGLAFADRSPARALVQARHGAALQPAMDRVAGRLA
jgi:hypothetical protein